MGSHKAISGKIIIIITAKIINKNSGNALVAINDAPYADPCANVVDAFDQLSSVGRHNALDMGDPSLVQGNTCLSGKLNPDQIAGRSEPTCIFCLWPFNPMVVP